MEYKRLLVLANSMKKDGRCVAGRLYSADALSQPGGWCRPISDQGEGELFPKHMTLEGNERLFPLDIVDVPVLRHANNAAHPEDWIVSGARWKRVEQVSPDAIVPLIEKPLSLWLEDAHHPDRVSPSYFQRTSAHQSLYLIRPHRLRLRLWKEFNQFKGYNQKKTRVLFDYAGVEYNFSLTDPVATDRHCKKFPEVDQPPIVSPFPFGDNCVLCVSLTPPFIGFHYKVVATVLELP